MYSKSYKFRAKTIRSLVRYFRFKKIDYCLLGNPKNIPLKIKTDVDLFINYKSEKNLLSILQDFTSKNNLKILNIFKHEYNSFTYILSNKNYNYYISLDICDDYVIDSKKILSLKSINKIVLKKNNLSIKVLPKNLEFFYYFIKKINKNDIDTESFKYLSKLFKSIDHSKFTKIFNHEDYILLSKIFNKNFFNLFKKYRSFFFYNFIRKKKTSYLKNILRIINRLFFKTGFHIVFIGTDGSGKSTQINSLINSNILNLFRGYEIFHLFNNYQEVNKKNVKPYVKKNFGIILSFFKIIYLYVSFLKNYIFKIYPLLVRSNLVVSDRYYHDVFIDPKRYRIGFFYKFIEIFYKLLPDPDLIIVMHSDIKSLKHRKNELNDIDIKINNSKYVKFVKNNNKAYLVSSNKNINITSKKIIKLICLEKLVN